MPCQNLQNCSWQGILRASSRAWERGPQEHHTPNRPYKLKTVCYRVFGFRSRIEVLSGSCFGCWIQGCEFGVFSFQGTLNLKPQTYKTIITMLAKAAARIAHIRAADRACGLPFWGELTVVLADNAGVAANRGP